MLDSQTPTISLQSYRPVIAALSRIGGWVTGAPSPTLDVDRLLASAERQTGLSDWGSLDIRTPLSLLAQDFREIPPSGLGRILLRSTFTKSAANRLLVRDAVRRMDKSKPLQAPFIVTGLHRTGTTLLHHLLCALPGHSFIPMYRLMSPVSRWYSIWETRAAMAATNWINPEFFQAHPSDPLAPEECWILMMGMFRVADYQLHWEIPRFGEWVDQTPMEEAYAEYRESLQLLNQEFPGRLVMKGPGHLGCLRALQHAIPDARIIWTHRDPVYAVSSFGTLSAVHHRSIYGHYDPHRTGQNALDRFALAARQGTEAGPHLDNSKILHVPYKELTADPVAMVRNICAHFGEPFDAEAEARVTRQLHEMREHKHPDHHYSLEQWGLSAQKIRAAFSDYLDVYGREAGVK